MMEKLQDNRSKVPAPTREASMHLTATAHAHLDIDVKYSNNCG